MFIGVAREACAQEKKRINYKPNEELGILSSNALKEFIQSIQYLIKLEQALFNVVNLMCVETESCASPHLERT